MTFSTNLNIRFNFDNNCVGGKKTSKWNLKKVDNMNKRKIIRDNYKLAKQNYFLTQ